MFKSLIITIIIILLSLFKIFSQVNKFGIPFIINYNSEIYKASTQNWVTCEDTRGVMYFGNNDCILEYDGKTWNKIYNSNNSSILSMLVDSSGTIFIGGINEFGYLVPDFQGNLLYTSLSTKLDTTITIGDIWKIFSLKNSIYFSSSQNLFRYNYSNLVEVVGNTSSKNGNLYHFCFDNDIFLGNIFEGLLILKDTFEQINCSDFFVDDYLMSVNDYGDNFILFSNYLKGNLLLNYKNCEFRILEDGNSNLFFQNNNISNATKLPNSFYAFSTILGGIAFTDYNLTLNLVLNKSNGLNDNTSYYTYSSKNDIVWATLNDGISKVELNSPFKIFNQFHGIEGNINDVIKIDSTIIIASNLGVYYLDNNYFKKIEGVNNETWFLDKIISKDNDIIIIGNNLGMYEFINRQAKVFKYNTVDNGIDYASFCFFRDSDYYYIGHYSGFRVIKREENQWNIISENNNFPNIISINSDDYSNIWLSSRFDGLARITKNGDTTFYNEESGLPSIKDIQIYNIHDNLIFATQKGLYSFNYETEKFEKFNKFGDVYCDGSCGVYLMAKDSNAVWINPFRESKEWIERVFLQEDGTYTRDTIAFKRLEIKSLQAIYPDKDGIVWFGTADGLISFDKNFERYYYQPFYALIRKITLSEDSVIFHGNYYKKIDNEIGYVVSTEQPDELIFEFPYSQNSITFEYAAPFFEAEEKTEFSVYLEGFDKKWTNWKTESKSIYTNLREGNYIFKVKAKNIYGVESVVAEYRFSISPPWYRTTLAYILYFILIIGIVILIIKLYTRQLIKDKQRLERIVEERTVEIRNKNEILEFQKRELEQSNEEILAQRDEIEAQKDEIEIQHNVVLEQKDKIEKQNHDIKDSIHYASRIQNALVPPFEIASKYLSEIFILWRPRDIVSGDFPWIKEKNEHLIIVAADCTGHGVPGAFMSMLGISLLNEIVSKLSEINSDVILNKLREDIISSLHQTGKVGENQDGMDLTMLVINKVENVAQFSAANNPLILVRKADGDFSEFANEEDYKFLENTETNTKLVEFKADKMPIGISRKADIPFTRTDFKIYEGDALYLLSDGYPDQFGGEAGKKFMIKNLKELFSNIYNFKLDEQKELLNQTMEKWIAYPKKSGGKQEQIDDILIIGVRI